ncbi:MAG: UMP kinase [Clostridia bacterium]|nr:UMP kinase [Clostridia bacterium]
MYKRVILKLSGETLSSRDGGACYDPLRVNETARILKQLSSMGVQLGVVLGGGNIWRGRFSKDMTPFQADQMGMLATIMNALCLEDALKRQGAPAVAFTAQEMTRFAELYRADRALQAMEEGKIALLAGGSGNPFFTTDTAAALRAAELRADAVFKGTTVAGVYDKDPNRYPDAKFLPELSYADCIRMNIQVMDITAFQLCRERGIPAIRIFPMDDLENILRVAAGERIGSVVHI